MTSAIRPDQLAEAVAAFLRERVVPALEGDLAFEARVSANALELVVRALREPPTVRAEHHARLVELTGRDGSQEELEALLCEMIRRGEIDESSPALMSHLLRSTIDALKVDQPRYSALRAREEA
jgi:hypothetical protein